MGQTVSFADKVELAICNSDRQELERLMAQPEFNSSAITVNILVELIQKQWSSEVIYKFATLANDDQVATLLSTAILHNHVLSLEKLFELMKTPSTTIGKHHLKDLFLTLCDRGNVPAVKDLIQFQCYDPKDERPLTVVFRSAMRKKYGIDEELLDVVAEAVPNHTETAVYLLQCLEEEVKNEDTKNLLERKLKAYMKNAC